MNGDTLKLLAALIDWANRDVLNQVELRGHVSGCRVSLKHLWHEMGTGTGDFVEAATAALASNPRAVEAVRKEEISRLRKKIEACTEEIAKAERQLTSLESK